MYIAQKPLSSVNLAVTKENFPACYHFWPCTESNDDTTLTDVVGGVVTGAIDIQNANGVSLSSQQAGAGAPLTEGTLVSPGSKITIMFVVGNFGQEAGLMSIGAAPGQGGTGSLQILGISDRYQASDAIDVVASLGGNFLNAIEGHALVYQPGASVHGRLITAANAYSLDGIEETIGVPTTNDINQSTAFGNSIAASWVHDLHGCAVFYFDALPDDLEVALQWMKAEWLKGNKSIYPGWKDRV